MSKTIKVPGYATNPIMGALKLEWFIVALEEQMKEDTPLNLFIVKNKDYRATRKKKGKFGALLDNKFFFESIREGCKTDSYIIGEMDNDKVLVACTADISRSVLESLHSSQVEFAIGATSKLNNDDVFRIIQRADQAVNMAQRRKIYYQIK